MTTLNQNIKKKWELTHDEAGVKPKFTPKCWFCKAATGKAEKMELRLTKLDIASRNTAKELSNPYIFVEYKCPLCAWAAKFYVPVDIQYWGKVFALRKNVMLHYPPLEVWNDNDIIELQLALLGYWGGRKDLRELLDKMKKTEQDPVRIEKLEALLKKMKEE